MLSTDCYSACMPVCMPVCMRECVRGCVHATFIIFSWVMFCEFWVCFLDSHMLWCSIYCILLTISLKCILCYPLLYHLPSMAPSWSHHLPPSNPDVQTTQSDVSTFIFCTHPTHLSSFLYLHHALSSTQITYYLYIYNFSKNLSPSSSWPYDTVETTPTSVLIL